MTPARSSRPSRPCFSTPTSTPERSCSTRCSCTWRVGVRARNGTRFRLPISAVRAERRLQQTLDRLRSRFRIGRVCVCVAADRGMIRAATVAALEERGLNYILGARERRTKAVGDMVLGDEGPFVPLLLNRPRGETQLFAKEGRGGRRALHRMPQRGGECPGRQAGRDGRPSTLPCGRRKGADRQSRLPGTCTARARARRSRSTPASSPGRSASTASSFCAPTPA